MSSKDFSQKGIKDWYVERALSTALFMMRLATVTNTVELMTVLNDCLNNSPLYAS